MKAARSNGAILGACFMSVVDYLATGDEFSDEVDRRAFAIVFGETLHAMRKSVTK